MKKKTILHLAFDYPDSIREDRTVAVKNLIANSHAFNHIIISLNRHTKFHPFNWHKEQNNLYVVSFFMLPFGIMMNFFLQYVSIQIAKLIRFEKLDIDVVHAHKMSVEAIIAFYLEQRLNLPFVLTVRGNSDCRIVKYKPNYHKLYRLILQKSYCNFVLSPWAAIKIEKFLFRDTNDSVEWHELPNFLVSLHYHSPQYTGRQKVFLMVFNLKSYKGKNLIGVLRAVRFLKDQGEFIRLDIVGGGDNLNKIEKIIQKMGIGENVKLLGHIQNEKLFSLFPNYCALINPSHAETFGYVYIEALSSGLPVILSENTGIDGYFKKFQVTLSVKPSSYKSIAAAMQKVIKQELFYKKEISRMFTEKYMDRFVQNNVIMYYEKTIKNAIV